MQPSNSVTLEPGLERGVPWGRDLYNFVTSAAGHMMRTLQKPRKSRPSKRQVNHRRFLHNMIQRKFANIEAANHRLASALFSTEENKSPSLPSPTPETPDQSGSPSQDDYLRRPDKGKAQTDMDGISKSGTDLPLGSNETEVSKKRQPDSGHLWKLHSKSQAKTGNTAENNQSKGAQRQTLKKGSGNPKLVEFISVSSPNQTDCFHGPELFHTEDYGAETLLQAADNLSEDTLCSWAQKVQDRNDAQFKHDSNSKSPQLSQNLDSAAPPPFSPELSPLSLDSCDFSIQMVTDVSTYIQAETTIADIVERQWTDMMDLFNVGDEDLGGCTDAEDYFESICACHGDGAGGTGGEVCADDFTFVDQSESFTEKRIIGSSGDLIPDVEELHNEIGEYGYEHGHCCHGDQGLTASHFCGQRSSQPLSLRGRDEASEVQFTSFKPSQDSDIIPNQLSTSTNYHYHISDLNTYQCSQQAWPSMLVNCECSNQNGIPFEGVAQSFSAPTQIPQHRPVPTPPHEDEWLFTDILEDRESPECQLGRPVKKRSQCEELAEPWWKNGCSPVVQVEGF